MHNTVITTACIIRVYSTHVRVTLFNCPLCDEPIQIGRHDRAETDCRSGWHTQLICDGSYLRSLKPSAVVDVFIPNDAPLRTSDHTLDLTEDGWVV